MNSNEMGQRMEKIMPYLLLLLLVTSVFFAVKTVSELRNLSLMGSNVRPANVITVSGKGEIFAVPDTANFTFSIEEEAETASQAQEKVTEKMNAVIETLKEFGIEEKDIKTVGYNLYPRYEYRKGNGEVGIELYYPGGERVLVGYNLSHTLSIKVRDSKKAGEVLGRVGQMNVSNISGINFVSEDEDTLIEEARKEAIADAKQKAKKLSKDLGVKLGRLVEFSDSSNGPIYYDLAVMESSYGKGGGLDEVMSAPELPQGENKIVSQVYLTFEIK